MIGAWLGTGMGVGVVVGVGVRVHISIQITGVGVGVGDGGADPDSAVMYVAIWLRIASRSWEARLEDFRLANQVSAAEVSLPAALAVWMVFWRVVR